MNIIDIGLFVGYFLTIISFIAAVVLPLIQAAGDPKSLLKSGIGVLALIIVFIVSYAVSDAIPYGVASATTVKLSGAGLICMYVLFFVAIIGIVYTEISKIIK